MTLIRVITLVTTIAVLVTCGTVFFHFVEGWSWLDSYFFAVVTLSTVGYGSLVPVTAAGKIGTTVFIFLGLGVFAMTIQQFGHFAMRKREEHTEWLVARLGHRQNSDSTEPEAANSPEHPPQ